MSRSRRLGVRRLRQRWEDDDPHKPGESLVAAPAAHPIWSKETLEALAKGAPVGCQPIPIGSNYTFAVALAASEDQQVLAIYKPLRGEVPLWDFPDGTLYKREYAAYLVSEALGWRFIPPTVIRDGPHGVGSMQLYVEPDAAANFNRFRGQNRDELCRITLFDHIANNADRKPNHVFRDRHGNVWGIDHGLTFHEDWKLRTVIWDFCEQEIPADLLRDMRTLKEDRVKLALLQTELSHLIDGAEIRAFVRRMDLLIESGEFPHLDPYNNVPRGWF